MAFTFVRLKFFDLKLSIEAIASIQTKKKCSSSINNRNSNKFHGKFGQNWIDEIENKNFNFDNDAQR